MLNKKNIRTQRPSYNHTMAIIHAYYGHHTCVDASFTCILNIINLYKVFVKMQNRKPPYLFAYCYHNNNTFVTI